MFCLQQYCLNLVQPEIEPRNDLVNGEEKKKWLQRWHIYFFQGINGSHFNE
ncbi:hypothetical protein T03_6410 [Trichinella britovi]|uniref:Uncharacterized protein n=1 Tax=Trichinella britovi TaxID=45882 RepID=A0A0V1DFY4_TRIBR|nr:hypothetical protein T03_6410 [Trichinella britovi]